MELQRPGRYTKADYIYISTYCITLITCDAIKLIGKEGSTSFAVPTIKNAYLLIVEVRR